MTKKELQRIALTMFNKGYINSEDIRYCDDMYDATEQDIEQCCEYMSELFRAGKDSYVKKYCIKERGK